MRQRRQVRLYPARADEPPARTSAGHDSPNLDSEDYGSFDEEELEILNDLLQGHSLPAAAGQAANVLPHSRSPSPLYSSLPILVTENLPNPAPVVQTTFPRVPISQAFEPSEGQFDDPEEEEDDDVEASGRVLQSSIPRIEGPQFTTGALLEVQYESVELCTTAEDKPVKNEVAESLPPPLSMDLTDKPPFSRFRGPKRGLSVTDLLSNTWCEQQFEYYLVRGKKRTTPAMRAGTKIHKKLEQQVHETVEIKVDTPEERLAMKLLNIIQGLRTLREIGMTREFPVFAFVKGLLVQGVIDEISYTKPVDKVYSVREEGTSNDSNDSGGDLTPSQTPKKRGRGKKDRASEITVDDEEDQSLMNFITSTSYKLPRVAHISDHKTRHRDSLPTVSQFRGTELQLMLYHYLLTLMASSAKVSAERFGDSSPSRTAKIPGNDLFSQLFELRNVDPYARFADVFLARISPLLDESDPEIDSNSMHSLASPDVIRFPTLTHITNNPTLAGLLQLLDTSFSLSLPTLSNTLSVSYRSQKSWRVLATKTVQYNESRMEEHLQNVLRWWQGERGAVGVPIEEAWKCQSCEFADECEWRLKKIAELEAEREAKKEKKIGKGKKKATV